MENECEGCEHWDAEEGYCKACECWPYMDCDEKLPCEEALE